MAVVSTLSNHYKYQCMAGNIDHDSDVFRVALMDISFAFNKDTHATFSDVIANEIAASNGYNASGEILLSGELTEDDANDRGNMTWGDKTWTASGGDFEATGAAIIFDDTSSDDTVVGCIDFGTNYTVTDGSSLQIQDPVVRLT